MNNTTTRRVISTILGLALLAGGVLIAVLFVTNKRQAERKRPMSSMIPVVETAPFKAGRLPLNVDCLGTVIADKTADLQSEVGGRVVAVAENLVEGELVKKGDVLVEIEPADYELALAKAEASLLTAQANYRIEEGQQDVVRHELELMGTDETDSYRDLMLREPQLRSARAAVQSAELAVETAKLNLARTKIAAPFDAVIIETDTDVGDYAQTSKVLVRLAATDRYFIRASIPLSSLEPLPGIGAQTYSATVTLSDGTTRAAQTHRLLPDLSEKGRMARLLLAVDNPYAAEAGRPLLLNEYVRVRIQGEFASDAALIPRAQLRDGNVVWMIDEKNTLRVLPAEVLQGYSNEVLVRVEAEPQMEMVTTDLAAAIDGMELRRVGEPAKRAPGAGKGAGKGAAGKKRGA